MTGKGIHGWRGGTAGAGVDAGDAVVEEGAGEGGPGRMTGAGAVAAVAP
jgi:hypothetical protein